jgi:predicted RNase H-like HicB family nuclease
VRNVRYEVVLYESEEGFAVQCPVLPGCWSQGETREEAIENIRDAIQEYLEVVRGRTFQGEVREIEVAI